MKDPVKQFKKLLILCWSTLTFYLIIKSFKPDMFVIVCNNKTLIRFGEMVDNSFVLQCITGLISSYICYFLFYGAILQKFWLDKKENIIFLIVLFIGTILKVLSKYIGIISDVFLLILLPIYLMKKNNVKIFPRLVLANLLNIGFQVLSMVIKNLAFNGSLPQVEGFTVTLIFMIDVYLMLLIYYLYMNIKRMECEKMSWMFSWFLGKTDEQVIRMKKDKEREIEKVLEKLDILKKELSEIETFIKEKNIEEK